MLWEARKLLNTDHEKRPPGTRARSHKGTPEDRAAAKELHTIPLMSMYGAKRQERVEVQRPWPWTHPKYTMYIPSSEAIKRLEIDPSKRMLDIDRSNNIYE